MKRPTAIRLITAAAVVAFVVGGFGLSPVIGGEPFSAADLTRPIAQMATEQAIAFFAARVDRDPGDALSATILSELHTRRGRETGDIHEYLLAARSAELALSRLPDHARAHLALARARFALHRFTAAVASAETAARLDPTLGAEVVVADAALATGDLIAAERIYSDLDAMFDSPALDARIAGLAEVSGDLGRALEIMTAARDDAATLGYTGESAGWFDVRLGDVEFATGDYQAAEAHYRRALQVFPRYPAAEAGLARSLAAQGRYQEAIARYERSIALQPTPDVLLSAARLYEYLGMEDRAWGHRSTLDLIVRLSEGVFDLAYTHHLIDVGRPVQALEVARGQAAGRSDPFTLDALAWAEYHNGDVAAAAAAMTQALATGVTDARILFHAGVIYSGVDQDMAAELLKQALSVNPEFDPVEARRARSLLAEMGW